MKDFIASKFGIMANRKVFAIYISIIMTSRIESKAMRYVATSMIDQSNILAQSGQFEDVRVASPMLCAALGGRRGAVA